MKIEKNVPADPLDNSLWMCINFYIKFLIINKLEPNVLNIVPWVLCWVHFTLATVNFKCCPIFWTYHGATRANETMTLNSYVSRKPSHLCISFWSHISCVVHFITYFSWDTSLLAYVIKATDINMKDTRKGIMQGN